MSLFRFLDRRVIAWALIAAPSVSVAGGAPTINPVTVWTVDGNFEGKKPASVAHDLSGITCLPAETASSETKNCIVINDENKSAQYVRLERGKMIVGSVIPLLGEKDALTAVGLAPTGTGCSNQGDRSFKDLDAEAVTTDANGMIYVVGSHGCSRKRHKFHPSSFLITRVSAVTAPVNSYRLAQALSITPGIREHLAQDLEKDGTNIEGLLAVDDRLLVGFRAPVTQGAQIVEVPAAGLFDPKAPPTPGIVHSLDLGAGAGIRDLAHGDAGEILVSSGPADDAKVDVPFTVWSLSQSTLSGPKALVTLSGLPLDNDGKPAKPEGLLMLREAGSTHLLVLFDGAVNGGAREYELPAPTQARAASIVH